ncbi:hypothetical protein CEP51_009905 [Fusarium floridanum]|uniref:ASX DEUBAD domain-containing protein n=1 Tax=Fusarium floridanum TaxID=1325733 RepID=A0A428RG40_9HYPO|nr:hypothetical protein CEP51_009905 [Fusarium floridanum]
MEETDDATIVASAGARTPPKKEPPSSSPLSSIRELELDDTASKSGQRDSSPTPTPKSEEATTTTSRKKNGKKRVVVRKTPRKSKWDADNILTDPKSPLASADLRAQSILSNPMAWDVLDQEEKAEILALFPDSQHILGSGAEACPDLGSLMNDDSFRYDCAAYTEHIAQGRHDPEWLAQAWAAHERRKAGDYDEYLDNKFINDWEVELPPELKTSRGPAASGHDSDATIDAVENGDDKSLDTKMGDVALDQRNGVSNENGVDELQVENGEDKEQKVAQVGQLKGLRMDVDGETTEDELA